MRFLEKNLDFLEKKGEASRVAIYSLIFMIFGIGFREKIEDFQRENKKRLGFKKKVFFFFSHFRSSSFEVGSDFRKNTKIV